MGAHRQDLGREAGSMTLMIFIGAGAAQGLVGRIAAQSGVEVAGTFGAVGAMLEKFLAGEPCDVVILTHAQIASLAEQGRVDGRTCADLGAVATAIAVRASDSAPDISGEKPLRDALLGADAIYFPDPAKATAGIHFAKVLDTLGIRAGVEGMLRTFPNGSTAMRAMAESAGHPIGCTQATEILATPGVRLVAPLPPGFDLETVYTAAVSGNSARPHDSADFVRRLTGDGSRVERAAAGFRGHSIRPATVSDLPGIRGVVHLVLGEYGLAPDPAGVDRDLEDFEASYFSSGGTFEVAVASDGSIAGCCGVFALGDTTCELRKMYLRKDARGFGLGGRLLRRALAYAKGRGFKRMELETASVLKEAIALYAGAGFTPITRTHLAARCDQAFALDL
jgi:molybdate transport system substrate-binding protein